MSTPAVRDLPEALDALRGWQQEGAAMQLHPGDLGWFWRFGSTTTAAAVRTWSRDGRTLAVGLLDGADLLRMTIAPDARQDEELGRQVVADVSDPGRGVLGEGTVCVEAPRDALVQDLLAQRGWDTDVPWSPLRRDLTEPVPDPGVRITVVGPAQVADRCAVHRSSFDRSTFTEERWRAVASGPAYAKARCLLAHDEDGHAVAAVTVWSAGPDRPGLLEPMGVHRDHRGRGHGRAITLAAAAALRDLGSSSAIVCTPSANVGGVATYEAAGFERLAEVRDRRRDAVGRS